MRGNGMMGCRPSLLMGLRSETLSFLCTTQTTSTTFREFVIIVIIINSNLQVKSPLPPSLRTSQQPIASHPRCSHLRITQG